MSYHAYHKDKIDVYMATLTKYRVGDAYENKILVTLRRMNTTKCQYAFRYNWEYIKDLQKMEVSGKMAV